MGQEMEFDRNQRMKEYAQEFSQLICKDIGPERQRRIDQEYDLIKASFLIRSEVFRRFQSLNSTEHIGDNSAMIEAITTTFFNPFYNKESQTPIAHIILPKTLRVTADVIGDILKARPGTPSYSVSDTGAEQLNAAITAARSTQQSSTPGRTVVILDADDDFTEIFNLAVNAYDLKLSSLTVIFNVQPTNPASKLHWAVSWRTSGWDVSDVPNGHNPGSLLEALNVQTNSGKPRVIFISTCSGKALPFEGDAYREQPRLSQDALASILSEREGIEELSSEPLEKSVKRLLA